MIQEAAPPQHLTLREPQGQRLLLFQGKPEWRMSPQLGERRTRGGTLGHTQAATQQGRPAQVCIHALSLQAHTPRGYHPPWPRTVYMQHLCEGGRESHPKGKEQPEAT